MDKKRPVNLALGSLKYPPMAIASILHRMSGIVLFLLLPMIIYMWSLSLQSAATFDQLQILLATPYHKFLLWAFTSALIYHLIAGIRHMIMDMGFAESVESGRKSASIVIIVAAVLILLLGVWIW